MEKGSPIGGRLARPEDIWPEDQVEKVGPTSYLVTPAWKWPEWRQWLVTETGQQWDAWPWPDCRARDFDDQAYRQKHLRGRGTLDPVSKIMELLGTDGLDIRTVRHPD